jgi:hypothetical protein
MNLNFKTTPMLILVVLLCSFVTFSQIVDKDKSDSNANSNINGVKQDLIMPSSSNETIDINISEFEITNSDGVKYIRKEDLPLPLPKLNYPPEYYENRNKSDNTPQ